MKEMWKDIPAFCPRCRTWLASGIGVGDNARNITIQNIGRVCPTCRGIASIFDGKYETVGGNLRIVAASGLNRSELQKLSQILQNALRTKTSAEELRQIIKEEVPEASELTKFIRSGATLIAVITLLLQIIQTLTPFLSANKSVDAETLLKAFQLAQAEGTQKPGNEAPPTAPASYVNRQKAKRDRKNAPCSCGRGRKQKKCVCGRR